MKDITNLTVFVLVILILIIGCHTDCTKCIGPGITGCTECLSPLISWNGECVSSCPPTTYFKGNSCFPCEPPCITCTEKACLTCMEEYYWDKEECVVKCSESKYPNDTSKTCEPCFTSCLHCYGPSDKDCTECKEGFSKDTLGRCKEKECSIGSYLNIECIKCHESCSTCSDDISCIECKSGYVKVSGSTLCKACEEINVGYYTAPNGKCKGK